MNRPQRLHHRRLPLLQHLPPPPHLPPCETSGMPRLTIVVYDHGWRAAAAVRRHSHSHFPSPPYRQRQDLHRTQQGHQWHAHHRRRRHGDLHRSPLPREHCRTRHPRTRSSCQRDPGCCSQWSTPIPTAPAVLVGSSIARDSVRRWSPSEPRNSSFPSRSHVLAMSTADSTLSRRRSPRDKLSS